MISIRVGPVPAKGIGSEGRGRSASRRFLDCRVCRRCRLNCVKSKSPYERAVYTHGCGTVRFARVFYSAPSDTPTCRFIQNIAGSLRRRPTAKPYYFDVLDFRTHPSPRDEPRGTRMNH